MNPEAEIIKMEIVRFKPDEKRQAANALVATFISEPPEDLENASLLTKAGRLRLEITAWVKSGAKLTPRTVRLARLAVCRACDYYDPAGNLGLGACKAPGCGCSRIKAALATSACPKGKWPA